MAKERVTSLWREPGPEKKKKSEEGKLFRERNPDHPWVKNSKRDWRKRDARRLMLDMTDQVMRVQPKLIVRSLQADPLYKVDGYWTMMGRNVNGYCVRVGISDKVFMMERYLPELAEKLGALLEQHHWKFGNSVQKLCGMEYYIYPDWSFWHEYDQRKRQEKWERDNANIDNTNE